ncbi:MAG: hypothetical protein WAS56_08915 [Saprospiraceae bacterium]
MSKQISSEWIENIQHNTNPMREGYEGYSAKLRNEVEPGIA